MSGGYVTRNSVILSSVSDLTNLVGYSREGSDNGWLVAAFGGYQAINRQWLLGGEFNIEWQNIDHSHDYVFSDFDVTAKYRRKGMLDLSGRLGYALTTNFMPYVRLGVELSRDSLTSTFVGSITSGVLNNKAWIHRFLLGMGVEMPIPGTCGITLRLEYDYHSKGKTIEDFGADIRSTEYYYTAMQPRSYSGRLSIVWNFFDSSPII
jgi:opacity protein-like surface antigen